MKNNYFTLGLVLTFAAYTIPSMAQDSTSVLSVVEQDLERQYLQWEHSSNAAGLMYDKPTQQSHVALSYQQLSGNFRRPQSGAKQDELSLTTRGNVYHKKSYIQGYFSYQRQAIEGAEYNTTLIDPFRGMPYMVADTNVSDWLNQHYAMGFKVNRPLGDGKVRLGLAANYKASSGAKQRDIRTLNKYYQLDLQPGITVAIAPKQILGTSFLYKNYKEEARNSNMNTYIDQGYYVVNGLGNGVHYVGSGRSYNYLGDELGAGLQYQYQGAIRALWTAHYSVKAEDALLSFSNARPAGSILKKTAESQLLLQYSSARFLHGLKANYSKSKSNGIEYITEFVSGLESDGYYTRYQSVRSTYQHTQAGLQYELVRPDQNAYRWKASAGLYYSNHEDRYLLPAARMKAENLAYVAQLNKMFALSAHTKAQLNVGLTVHVQQNLQGAYEYSGAHATEVLVTDLEQRNMLFYTADYQHYELPLTYAQQLPGTSSVNVFVRASANYTQVKGAAFTDRKSFRLTLGATF